jgi:hypothetical protein
LVTPKVTAKGTTNPMQNMGLSYLNKGNSLSTFIGFEKKLVVVDSDTSLLLYQLLCL